MVRNVERNILFLQNDWSLNKFLASTVIVSILSIVYLSNSAKEKIETQQNLQKTQLRSIQSNEIAFNESERESEKRTIQKKVILDFIKENNEKLSDTVASKYANVIIRESHKNGNSPYIQAALLKSETDFRTDVKHDIKDVIGMGGIYFTVWGDELKAEGIITKKSDLKNPYMNIAASSYILKKYNSISDTPREALARYKGYCSLGKSQGNKVMEIALSLKAKERSLSSIA